MTDTPTRADLLPCPFCGGGAHMPYYGDRVECRECKGSVMTIAAWNTRAPTADAERIAALEGEVERLREREAELHGQLMRMIDRWEDQRAALKGTDHEPA